MGIGPNSFLIELLHDISYSLKLLYFLLSSEEVHVVFLQIAGEFEILLHVLIIGLLSFNESADEVDVIPLVILFYIFKVRVFVFQGGHFLFQECLIVSNAFVYWNFSNRYHIAIDIILAMNNITPFFHSFNSSCKFLPPDFQLSISHFLSLLYSLPDQINNILDGMWQNSCAPACSNSLAPVDQNQGQYWNIEFRFNDLSVVLNILNDVVIGFIKKITSQWIKASENVPGWCAILPIKMPCSKLPDWLKEVQVIGPCEILSHANNGGS